MIKNILGAVVGAKLAQNSTKVDNGTGAILGSIAPAVIARMSLPAMIVLGAGGYLVKRYRDQQAANGTAGDAATPAPRIPPAYVCSHAPGSAGLPARSHARRPRRLRDLRW